MEEFQSAIYLSIGTVGMDSNWRTEGALVCMNNISSKQ